MQVHPVGLPANGQKLVLFLMYAMFSRIDKYLMWLPEPLAMWLPDPEGQERLSDP